MSEAWLSIIAMKHAKSVFSFLFLAFFFSYLSIVFLPDEQVIDDEDFGLEGGRAPDLEHAISTLSPLSLRRVDLESPSNSKSLQFTLEHAFGDSAYSPARNLYSALQNLESWWKDPYKASLFKE